MNQKISWISSSAMIVGLALGLSFDARSQELSVEARQTIEQVCQTCHGQGGVGGDRAPALANSRSLRTRSEEQIQELIRTGTTGGMPPFLLPGTQVKELAHWVRSLNFSASDTKPPGNVEAGKAYFLGAGQCSSCHMVHGTGTAKGPDLSEIGKKSTVPELEAVLLNPTSQIGNHTTPTCPSWAFCPDETWRMVNVQLRDGSAVRGFLRNQANRDIQIQDLNGKLRLLTAAEYATITREATSSMPAFKGSAQERRDLVAYLSSLGQPASGPLLHEPAPLSAAEIQAVLRPKLGEWPNFGGGPDGNRYSALNQINRQNVSGLELNWMYSISNDSSLEGTPVVADGVMYVTSSGKVCAIDATSGREAWCHTRSAAPMTPPAGAQGAGGGNPQGGGHNKGATVIGDRVFYDSADAHLICLNRFTGAVMWDADLIDFPEAKLVPGRFRGGGAPLVVGDLIVAGIAGGDGPIQGFLAAYKVTTGQLAWRFSTIPKPGDPGSETWAGHVLPAGGGGTWMTGSYDPDLDLVYWAVGNPFPATDGDDRMGANLYSNCVLAIEAKTGKLRWYYSFTPHDLHDWDATEPFSLVDVNYRGRPRKLLLQANRNGFFYVLDRTNGQFLLGKPFVTKMNWASGIDDDGKPILLPANFPTKAGVKTCPDVRGGTNWYASSYSPESKLYYINSVESCSIYRQSTRGGYEGVRDPTDPPKRYMRAFDIETGKRVWEAPQVGSPESNYSGILSTAGGLVFYGETSGTFVASDSKTGALLWEFTGNDPWKAAAMSYTVKGRQYVAILGGGNVLSFALKTQK